AGGDIDVVQLDPAGQLDDAVPAILALAPATRRVLVEGQPRQHGDTVIALHAVHQHVAVAERREGLAREMLVGALGLLQAEDVGLVLFDEAAHEIEAQPHRVDVPGRQRQRQSASPIAVGIWWLVSSCPDLIRASTSFLPTLGKAWIAGSSPAM